MSFLINKKERQRFIKFSFVGVTGTVVDFGTMNLLSIVFSLPLIWAQGISFTLAVLNNYLWNRYWTYPESRTKSASRQLLQFTIINVIGLIIRTPLITWLDRLILNFINNADIALSIENTVISQNFSLALSIVVILFWNFFANRYWTYANVPIGEGN